MSEGYFSLLRWRADPTRDEGRNVAVLLVGREDGIGALRHAPISSISPRLHEQGILDDVLAGLQATFESGVTPKDLERLHKTFERSVVVTAPQRVVITEPEETLKALYRAMVAPRSGGSRALTKGTLLDKVVGTLRSQGVPARRGAYIDDFIFDVVIANGSQTVLEVLSFEMSRKDWTPVERDAAHFLYALGRLREIDGRAIIQPPGDETAGVASFERVARWFEQEQVQIVSPDALGGQLVLDLAH